MHRFSKTTLAELGLVLVTILWGLTFPVIRLGVQDFDARYFVFIRFVIATVAFLPILFIFRVPLKGIQDSMIPGILSGLVISLTYIFQTIGLETVPSPRAAFITAGYVIFVPLLSPLFGRGIPRLSELARTVVALAGLYLILDPRFNDVSTGDLWVLGCALASAVAIHVMGKLVTRPLNLTALSFWQLAGVMLGSMGALTTVGDITLTFTPSVIMAILVCALGVSLGAFILQARCQKYLSPERTAMVYALEPIFACIFGFFILNELMTWRGLLGGLILISAVSGGKTLAVLRRPLRFGFRRPRLDAPSTLKQHSL